jgi:class III poly(R)-hydroxyalkanoic acid synthase PhaE subunit
MTDNSSTRTWTDLWLDTQRQYWNSWMDLSRTMYGNPMEKETEKAENPAPTDAWAQTIDFWSKFINPPISPEPAPPETAQPSAAGPGAKTGSWTDAWLDAQRGYWHAWLDLSRQMAGDKAEAASELPADIRTRFLDFWSTLLLPLLPAQSREGIGRMLEVNRAYTLLGEGLWRALAASYAAAQGAGNPWDVFRQGVRKMQDDFTEQLRTGKNPWGGFATFWGMPLDNWRRVCSAFSVLPGDMEKAARGFGSPYGPETLHETMVGFLSMPTLGYTREWQEEFQRWAAVWLEYGQALQGYGAILSQVTVRAMDLFGKKLHDQAARGEVLAGLRGFYNLWIDCAEDAYAEISVSPEFIEAQTRLTNSVFAVKRQEQKMVEEWLAAFNMPTRRELDTSHKRVHQLQRRVWQVEQNLAEAGTAELREQVDALQRELAALRADFERQQAEQPAVSRRGGAKSTT